MKSLIVVSTALTLMFSSYEVEPSKSRDEPVTIFGVGGESCAWWLSSPQTRREGFGWIMGYFSGRNIDAVLRHEPALVGQSTDGRGVAIAVETLCRQAPSVRLSVATTVVYSDFRKQDR